MQTDLIASRNSEHLEIRVYMRLHVKIKQMSLAGLYLHNKSFIIGKSGFAQGPMTHSLVEQGSEHLSLNLMKAHTSRDGAQDTLKRPSSPHTVPARATAGRVSEFPHPCFFIQAASTYCEFLFPSLFLQLILMATHLLF